MKKPTIILLTGLSIMLTACNKIPKECEQSWEHIADMAKKVVFQMMPLRHKRKNLNVMSKKCQKIKPLKPVMPKILFLVW